MDLEDFFRSLQIHKIRYLLCGGLAVNIYGIPRSTADVDILLDFSEQNVVSFMTAMNLLSFRGTLPIHFEALVDIKERERLISERNLIAYSFFNSARNVFTLDVLVSTPAPFEDLWTRREIRPFASTNIQLVSITDLIKMRKQQTESRTRMTSSCFPDLITQMETSKGFHYTVSDEELERHQQRTTEERIEWVWQTMLLLRAVQTRQERIKMLEAKWDKNIEYYHRFGFPEHV